MIKRTFILFGIFCISLSVHGQLKLSKNDSVQIKQTSESFFIWYADLIRTRQLEAFNPQFVKDAKGMTTLDYSSYRDGLKKHHFTRKLIERRISNFKECSDNLTSINYDLFLKFEDLDQFEAINCDFANTYEFTGGMDPIDGADLMSIKLIDDNKALSTVTLYYLTGSKKYPFGQQTITLIKDKKGWKISEL